MPMMSEKEISRLFRIRKTVMQMLKDRNYLVGELELGMNMKQFINKYGENMKREDLVIKKSKKNDSSDQIYVFFPREPKLGLKTLKTYVMRMKRENIFRAILVVKQNLTPLIRACIGVSYTKFHMEVFKEAELLVNIKNHVPVPESLVLTNDEKKTLRDSEDKMEYDSDGDEEECLVEDFVNLSLPGTPVHRYFLMALDIFVQLSRIQVIDQIARYYGLKRGQVVKIIIHSETASETAGRYVV